MVADTSLLLNKALDDETTVLFEGARATMLVLAAAAAGADGVARASGSASRIASSRSPDPRPCRAADQVRLPQPKRHSWAVSAVSPLVVDLVRGEHHRPLGAAQHPGDGLVGPGGAHGGVDDDQHRVGGSHRELGLRGHLGLQAPWRRAPTRRCRRW